MGLYQYGCIHSYNKHWKATYITMVVEARLNSYLADIDEQAEEMFYFVDKINGRKARYA